MSLIKKDPDFIKLRGELESLIKDIQKTEVTDDNARLAWESIHKRINALSIVEPFDRGDLHAAIDGDYKDEYHQITSNITRMFDELNIQFIEKEEYG